MDKGEWWGQSPDLHVRMASLVCDNLDQRSLKDPLYRICQVSNRLERPRHLPVGGYFFRMSAPVSIVLSPGGPKDKSLCDIEPMLIR